MSDLRERLDDLLPLAEHFVTQAAQELGRRFQSVSTEALGLLRLHPWRGNVRELKAVIGRAVLLHDDDTLRPAHLPDELVSAALAAPPPVVDASGTTASIPTLEAVELAHIRRVLEVCGGNRTLAAQHLDITRQTLTKRLGGPTEE